MEYDVILKDARIIDGTGKPAYKGSIGVSKGKIAALGGVKGDAKETINAKGFYASPGWIDAHSHADITLLDYDKLEVTGDAIEPRKHPKGIIHVLVNGVSVVENGKHTGATPGRIIKRVK